MRKVPKRDGKRTVAVLCALLATSACTQQGKKTAPPRPTSPSSSEQQVSTLSVTLPTYSGPLRLHEVRVIESLGQHSVLFRLSRSPEGIDYFPLRNPNRLVIDIKGEIAPLPQVQHYKAADPLITAVRVGNYQGRMRLVVDLKDGDPLSFSIDNYDTLITAFIGEKSEKANGKARMESNAQVLFLADEGKEASRTQLASGANRLIATTVPEKLPLASAPTAVSSAVDSSRNQPEASIPSTEGQQIEQPLEPIAFAPQASATTSLSTPAPSATPRIRSADETPEERLAPPPLPTQFAANLTESLPTEEEPWEVERVTHAPASVVRKARRTGKKEAAEPLLLARGDSAPVAAEFRPDQLLQYTGNKISLDFKTADIHDVLRIIAEVSGLNIVATDDVKARVTLRLVEVPWDQALDVVLQANGLEKNRTGNVITVSTIQRLETERNAQLAAQNAQQKLTPVATEYVKVNYVKATDVAALITRETQQRIASAGAGPAAAPRAAAAAGGVSGGGGRSQQVALMSPRGTIAADATTNVLIIRDLPDNIAAVRELIRNVDVQTPQVVIESYLVTTTENLNRNLGIQWGYNYRAGPETGNPTGVNFPGRIGFGGSGLNTGSGGIPFIADFPAAGAEAGSGAALDLLLGSLSGSQALDVRLTALEREGKARIISRPRVVTINNKAADIRSRRVVRVPIVSGSLNVGGEGATQGGGNAFQEFDVGITLKVTPQISSDGFVLLDIDAETSDLAPASVQPTGSGSTFPLIPDTLTRTASSNVLIRAGDTFVLGGILQDDLNQQESGFPYLRDTPGLGWLFRGRSQSRIKSELLVFITPKLVAGVSNITMPTAQQLWENRPQESVPQATVQP